MAISKLIGIDASKSDGKVWNIRQLILDNVNEYKPSKGEVEVRTTISSHEAIECGHIFLG